MDSGDENLMDKELATATEQKQHRVWGKDEEEEEGVRHEGKMKGDGGRRLAAVATQKDPEGGLSGHQEALKGELVHRAWATVPFGWPGQQKMSLLEP